MRPETELSPHLRRLVDELRRRDNDRAIKALSEGPISPINGLRLPAAPVTRPHAFHHRHFDPHRRTASDRRQHGADRARRARRLRRPQRRRQDRRCSTPSAANCRPKPAASRMPPRWRIGSLAQEAPDGPESLIDVVLKADLERDALLARSRDRRTIRTGSPKSRPGSSTSTPIPRRRAPPRSSPASAFRPRTRRGPARNSPAAGACAWRSPRRCSPRPTCCCSTSRPTISISKARCGWKTISRTIRAP